MWEEMLSTAINYSCVSAEVRKMTQKAWKENSIIGMRISRKAVFSTPMNKPEEEIVDCCIDGYDFFWLRNSNDYTIAGDKLQNCLTMWSIQSSPVVCVKKGDEYVAAIEISGKTVIQAKGWRNTDIEDNEELQRVFYKWLKQYNMEWKPEEDELDDNEFLQEFDVAI